MLGIAAQIEVVGLFWSIQSGHTWVTHCRKNVDFFKNKVHSPKKGNRKVFKCSVDLFYQNHLALIH